MVSSSTLLLLLSCLIAIAAPLRAQTDAHLRLSGLQSAQYVSIEALQADPAMTGSPQSLAQTYLVSDSSDTSISAQKSVANIQGKKHRRVKHGHHKRGKSYEVVPPHKGGSSYVGGSKGYGGGRPEEEHYEEHPHRPGNDGYKDGHSGYKPSTPSHPPHYPKEPPHHGGPDGPAYEGSEYKGRDKWQHGSWGHDGDEYEGDDDDKSPGDGPGPDGKDDYTPPGGDSYPPAGYPGSGYTPLGSGKNICKQVVLEEEEVEVVFTPTKDKATVTTLLGTCSNPTHPLPTLGGGCVVECQHVEDLCNITPLNSHVFLAPANFKAVENYYPVMCSYRTDAPLKGSCNIVMKVACCSDKLKYEVDASGAKPQPGNGKAKAAANSKPPATKAAEKPADTKPSSAEDEEEYEEEYDEYYALVKSKLLRIPLPAKY